jgi:single-strand DNA-binding protein
MSVNKVILVGNVGKNPETRAFQDGTGVTSFSLATSEKYKDKSGNLSEQTEWHNISCFGKLSEIASK